MLNYTQGKQLNLLKNLGFESPSWEDLIYLLIAIVVVVALCGAAWTLWDRSRQDPWLRLLARARKGALQRPAWNCPPAARRAANGAARWSQRVSANRAAGAGRLAAEAGSPALCAAHAQRSRLAALQREFKQLAWPT